MSTSARTPDPMPRLVDLAAARAERDTAVLNALHLRDAAVDRWTPEAETAYDRAGDAAAELGEVADGIAMTLRDFDRLTPDTPKLAIITPEEPTP